jgi:hypothetical protein
MTNSVRPTRTTAQPDDDFREFVVGFADPLMRLAFALTVHAHRPEAHSSGASDRAAPDVLATDALARMRRRWREAHESGAPEFVAVEALLSNLGRGRGSRRRDKVAAGLGTDTDAPVDASRPDDVDMGLVRAALWRAFQHLPLRQRVPLVFADPSVASRRLAGFGVPASFSSERRQEVSLDAALLALRSALRSGAATAAAADLFTDDEIVAVTGEAVREHAAGELAPVDPYPVVRERARQKGRRTGILAAVVVVVVAVAGVGVAKVSTPEKVRAGVADPETASSAAPSRSGVLPNPARLGGGQVALGPGAVVSWPVRGSAAGEPVLLANLRALFLADHPDVTGPAQVLLAADTPAFRVAYVTATSASGVVQAWFYGPVGSSELKEGAASFGGSLVANASVIASGLVDSAGHMELVVIAPPTTTGMSIADFDFSRPIGAFQALPEFGGVALKDVATGSVATLELHVIAGGQRLEVDHMPVINLGTPPALAAVHAQPSVGVERGQADPILLAEALQVASVWAQQDPSVAAHPVVLWGGTDAAGTQLVVLRMKGKIVDVVILEWSGDAPGLHGEILMHSTAPEVPIAFAYRAVGGTRIGVIGSEGATHAVLDFGGKASAPVALDATGFASFPVTNPSPPPSNDASSDLEIVAQVRLFDASGHLLETVPEPPSV